MSTKNLWGTEAQEKIKELAESIDFTMMASKLKSAPFHIIPMSTKKVDKDGNIWFLSGKDSEHNQHIENDGKVHLVYSNPSSMEFLNIYGDATIVTEKGILENLYGKTDDAWFDGFDDPNLTAISVIPRDAHYWDTKNNKLVSLLKWGYGAMTGQQPDIGEDGEINL